MTLPGRITVREVGPRDGLQAEAPVAVEQRVRLVESLVAAGARDIEAVAFVSPKAVPSMAGAAEVMALLARRAGVRFWALVPNLRGAEMALEAGADALSVTLSASPTYSEKNTKMTIDEAVEGLRLIAAAAGDVAVDAVISCAFGSPYEGEIAPAEVLSLAQRCAEAGARSLTLADTTGMATPRRVEELLNLTGVDVGLHLHETRATGLVNAYAAMQMGVSRFDTSVGGLGGSPFAAGAAGNLATEALVHLCDDLGVETGLDLGALVETARWLEEVVGHRVPSAVAAAGGT
ncbi:MAG: hydroxymethylglutaryl-CoA lyase [Acidimicrobiia bacterium]